MAHRDALPEAQLHFRVEVARAARDGDVGGELTEKEPRGVQFPADVSDGRALHGETRADSAPQRAIDARAGGTARAARRDDPGDRHAGEENRRKSERRQQCDPDPSLHFNPNAGRWRRSPVRAFRSFRWWLTPR